MWPRYSQWAHTEYILNVPSHLTPMYPVAKQSGTFSMFGEMWSQCAQWVKCWIYSKYASPKKFNVTKGQVLIRFTIYLVMWLSCIQIMGLGTSGTMCWTHCRKQQHSKCTLQNGHIWCELWIYCECADRICPGYIFGQILNVIYMFR